MGTTTPNPMAKIGGRLGADGGSPCWGSGMGCLDVAREEAYGGSRWASMARRPRWGTRWCAGAVRQRS